MLHNSYLLIDTDALRHNIRVLQAQAGKAKLVPVIKDDAYGLGAVSVAKILVECGIDTFAVSHVSEGLELRQAGIDKAIWILSIPLSFQVEDAVSAGLILPLASFHQLETLKAAATRAGHPIDVQIKLDTGLHRIGFLPDELKELAAVLKENRVWFRVVGSFSHFSDMESACMEKEYLAFLSMLDTLRSLDVDPGICHISSSAPLEETTRYNMDAVRIGRRLYMDNPVSPLGDIREVASLRTWIADIRTRRAGEAIAYGNELRLEKDTPVGVLPVGYGDGLDLNLFHHHAPVLIHGRRAPLLACCMDQSFVDLSGIDCAVGDNVTFFGYDPDGNCLSSQAVASLIGANEGCGLTSSLSTRVQRVFTGNRNL